MTLKEMHELKYENGEAFRIERAVHLHDEDDWNEYTLTYNGIIVGSELVSKAFAQKIIDAIKQGAK